MKRRRWPVRVAVSVVLLGVFATSATGCWSTPDAGKIGVVRNGGPFDNHNIRQVVCPGSGNTWTGLGSSTHWYPDGSQQRTFKFDTTEDADAKPITVPTKDGVRARITGTFFFKTAFSCSADGVALLKKFDQAFVARPAGQQPWDDWSGWLNATAGPIIDSNMRQIVAGFECRQLVSSCTLVQNTGQQNAPTQEEISKVDNRSNVQQIQDGLQEGLKSELKAKLGADFFSDIIFNLQSVELPGVQEAIDEAQKAYAQVSKAAAGRERAKQERLANEEKQKGYNVCASCARQDELRAIPSRVTTLVLGSGSSIAVGGGK